LDWRSLATITPYALVPFRDRKQDQTKLPAEPYCRLRTDGLNGSRERLADHQQFRPGNSSQSGSVIAILSLLAVFALISALIADAFR
jgi:hypothetical protein